MGVCVCVYVYMRKEKEFQIQRKERHEMRWPVLMEMLGFLKEKSTSNLTQILLDLFDNVRCNPLFHIFVADALSLSQVHNTNPFSPKQSEIPHVFSIVRVVWNIFVWMSFSFKCEGRTWVSIVATVTRYCSITYLIGGILCSIIYLWDVTLTSYHI